MDEQTIRMNDGAHNHEKGCRLPWRSAVIVVSDRCSLDPSLDSAGAALCAILQQRGHIVAPLTIVADERAQISTILRELAAQKYQLILTSGGTGLAPRDVTPEATLDAADRLVPGIPEAMRAASMAITPKGCLSRGVAVLIGKCLVVNLPGSEKGATENFLALAHAIEHGMEMASGKPSDCAGHYKKNK